MSDRSAGWSSRSRQLRHVGRSFSNRASSGCVVALCLPLVGLCTIGGEMLKPVLEPFLDRSALGQDENQRSGGRVGRVAFDPANLVSR